MNFRCMVGICILLMAVAVLPISALSGEVSIPVMPNQKTGTVWVNLTNISGSGEEGPVKVTYAMGDVFELPGSAIDENPVTGTVTVTVDERTPAGQFTLSTRNATTDRIYIINSVAVASDSDPLLANGLPFTAPSEVANYYMDSVPEGKQHEWIDLDWKDKNRDLGLMVFAPDSTLGPYTDNSDGRKDGRIFLDIASRLNVTAGTWFFRVQNSQMDRTPYTLNTYSA